MKTKYEFATISNYHEIQFSAIVNYIYDRWKLRQSVKFY